MTQHICVEYKVLIINYVFHFRPIKCTKWPTTVYIYIQLNFTTERVYASFTIYFDQNILVILINIRIDTDSIHK